MSVDKGGLFFPWIWATIYSDFIFCWEIQDTDGFAMKRQGICFLLTMTRSLEVDWVKAPSQGSWGVCDVSVKIPAIPSIYNHPNSHQDNDKNKDSHN